MNEYSKYKVSDEIPNHINLALKLFWNNSHLHISHNDTNLIFIFLCFALNKVSTYLPDIASVGRAGHGRQGPCRLHCKYISHNNGEVSKNWHSFHKQHIQLFKNQQCSFASYKHLHCYFLCLGLGIHDL